jgi:hypothetical protein
MLFMTHPLPPGGGKDSAACVRRALAKLGWGGSALSASSPLIQLRLTGRAGKPSYPSPRRGEEETYHD